MTIETAATTASAAPPGPVLTATVAAGTAAARTAVAAQLTGRTNRIFYVVVLIVALVGSSTAARGWLITDGGHKTAWWVLPAALAAVSVYELGAVAVSRFADQRRRLGERALLARAASAALAAGAIAAQALGHDERGPAAFFAGVSACGYVIYLLEAGASRRDALREQGKLADTAPAYGPIQWLCHPGITHRARALALVNAEQRLQDETLPALGRATSLAAARDQARAERRLAAIEGALRARIAAGVDKTMAEIAVNTYSLARVAEGIAAAADYAALTRIITAELVPARLVKLDPAETVPAGPVRAAGPIDPTPEPPAVETGPVPVPAPVLPAPAEPVPAPAAPPADGPVPPVVPAQPQPPAAETDDETGSDQNGADQGETGETAPDVLAGIAPRLVPYLAAVVTARTDWAVAIHMPPKHPDALNVPKIMAAASTSGKGLGVDLRAALIKLAPHAETAERALRSRGLTTAASA